MSPYIHTAHNLDQVWESIISVSAANDMMKDKFPSNIITQNCTVKNPVPFEILPDSHPEIGIFLDSVRSMQVNLAESLSSDFDKDNSYVVIGGDHTISIGTALGLSKHLDMSKVGLIWVDAHGDFNTPQTSLSKSCTGYPSAVSCGYGPELLTKDFKGNVIENITFIGLRDIDELEINNLKSHGATMYSILDVVEKGLPAIMKEIISHSPHIEHFWLSLDIDVLDPVYFKQNETDVPVAAGLTPRELLYITHKLRDTGKLLITELVQLNDMNTTTDLTVLSSRITELALGLGGFRVNKT